MQLPNLSPSSSLYYVYGAFLGDGTLDRSKWGVKLGVTQKEFAESFKYHLGKLGLRAFSWVQIQKSASGEMISVYYTLTNSKVLFRWLQSNPQVPPDFYVDFLRGFYEAEGSQTRQQVKFRNTELQSLKMIQQMLQALEYSTNLIPIQQNGFGTKVMYELYLLGGRSERTRFLREINPCIKGVAG